MMDDRLAKFSKGGHRNILEYNSTVGSTPRLKIPYILVVVDELADILLDSRKEPKAKKDEFGGLSEGDPNKGSTIGKTASRKLAKLAQKARASGIHILASTQRPSVKLLEGDIKSNFPARLSFRLPSEADSRTILGFGGAEHLLSRGDMLFVNPNKPGIARIHAPLSTIDDIKAAIEFASRR
jgi:S-DNA-T family DNA segregation ATPase FtsK/SpoIIIE